MDPRPPLPTPAPLARFGARLIRATVLIDRGAALFDRLRSRLVVSLASDTVLDAYNATAFGNSGAFQPDATNFRRDWFPWERAAISRVFPPAPARVLVGGAGGGREALRLVEAGFRVVAFDPIPGLSRDLARQVDPNVCQVLVGRYEQLPEMRSLAGEVVPLSGMRPFDAGIMGWTSLAHVRDDAARVAAVRQFAALVNGPVLLSVYPPMWRPTPGRTASEWLYAHGAVFSTALGRFQTFDEAQLRDLLTRAGVEIVSLDVSASIDNWPHAVVRATRGE